MPGLETPAQSSMPGSFFLTDVQTTAIPSKQLTKIGTMTSNKKQMGLTAPAT